MGADRGLETRAGLFPADFEQRPSEAVNGFAQPGIERGNEAVMQVPAREVLRWKVLNLIMGGGFAGWIGLSERRPHGPPRLGRTYRRHTSNLEAASLSSPWSHSL